ncbi:hypothetical protein HYT57_01025 [Candidatus Woesearchaeota archaeon]|nr:hypothetical protein [Candidatus Woesearchaeota archaeon]
MAEKLNTPYGFTVIDSCERLRSSLRGAMLLERMALEGSKKSIRELINSSMPDVLRYMCRRGDSKRTMKYYQHKLDEIEGREGELETTYLLPA